MNGLLEFDQQDEVQVWPSYTDVAMNIVLLLLVYLFGQVLIATESSAANRIIAEREKQLAQEIISNLPERLRGYVQIETGGNLLRLTFKDRVLFDTGKDELKPEGADLLNLIGRTLAKHTASFRNIQIEGHTDNVPIRSGKFASNWELSSARATSVVRYLQDAVGMEPQKLSATGYSEYQAIKSNDTDQGRAQNRRIEMVVVYWPNDIRR